MDKHEQKKIVSRITKEMSKIHTQNAPKLTNRDFLIKLTSVVTGLIFLINTFVYYAKVINSTDIKTNHHETKVLSNIKNEKETDKINNNEGSVFTDYKKMGDEALAQNQEQDAIKYYKLFINNNPQEPNVLTNLINLLVKNKLYENSLEYLEKLINVQPKNISAYRVKGSSLYLLERYDEAIKVFSKVVEMDQNDNNSYKLMGDMALKLNIFQDAIKYYKKALSIRDNDLPAYQNIGLAEAKIGRYEEALKYYEKALQMDPQNKDILKNKQQILSVLKN